MSAPTFNRRPKGTPVGGQFAEGRRHGASTTLTEADAAFEDGQSELDRAHDVGTGAWTGAHRGYVEEAIHSYGAGRVMGRLATVFPWGDGNRVAITEMAGLTRREVLCEDFDDFDTAVRFAEDNLGWGESGVEAGSRTPWGKAQHATHLAPGITAVSTDGHGGIKLSAQRNKEIPSALRNRSGWYEEDCEAHIVEMAFPHETRPRVSKGYGVDRTAAEWEQMARESVRDWYPDAYETVTGEKVQPGESHVRDRELWDAEHANDWVTRSVSSAEVPDGMVKVTVSRGADERRILMPRDEYRNRQDDGLGSAGRFAVDPHAYEQAAVPPPAPKVPTQRYTSVRTEGLTAAQSARVAKDLAKRYRNDDGSVSSVGQMITAGLVSGKSVDVENGARKYYLSQKQYEDDSSYSVLPVTKATWEAFGAPDTRTPVQAARQDWEIAQHKVEKLATGSFGRVTPEERKAQDDERAAHAAYRAALDSQTES